MSVIILLPDDILRYLTFERRYKRDFQSILKIEEPKYQAKELTVVTDALRKNNNTGGGSCSVNYP